MKLTRNHEQAAIIIILTELYLNIAIPVLSPKVLKQYSNFDGLTDDDLIYLLNDVVSQLKDLDMLSTGDKPVKQAAMYAHPRLKAQIKLLMDKMYENESLEKFLNMDNVKRNDIKSTIINKIQEDGIDIFVEIMFSAVKNIFPEILPSLLK